ncbi:MAG: amidohydrolase family protein [Solirubrobacteraceae bacterium]
MRIDVHQHIWTEPLLDALAARKALPFVRYTGGLAVLHSAGEQPYVIDVASELPDRRASLMRGDGLDLALIAISSPIGIEALPRESAGALIAAHLAGVELLGAEFARWGPVALDETDADDVDALVERGCLGVSLPAAALAGRDALDGAGPLLERIAARRVPLLVHPGPAPGRHVGRASLSEPLWWRALTDYVAQMQAAWLTFATLGRRAHPELVVVFAMLAGGAPLLSERLAARGGPVVDLCDPLSFYDTSSYGPAAIAAMALQVGGEQLVYGSDRPVAEPVWTGREALLQANGARLLAPIGTAA